jgi:hypothetical protein
MEHEHGNAAWTSTCYMSNVHVHAAWMSMLHGCMSILHVHTACPCPYCLFMSLLHLHVHGACPGPCCQSMSMLLSMSMLQVHVHAVCSCPCSRDIDMQHRRGHPAWACTRSMCCDMQQGHKHAART